jgi:Capsule assembly protein Wzi
MFKRFLLLLTVIFVAGHITAQEKINSIYNDYFDYLVLTGQAENPALMYHSLSNNNWVLDDDHIWNEALDSNGALITGESFLLKLISPQLVLSGNTAYDRSELSDGSWWQGKGINSFFSGGLKFESDYFDMTFMPEIWFAQNLSYDIMTSVAVSEYGYFFPSIDLPQRMGGDTIFEFNWGQTDIRFNWNNLTLGFSNENILWGPSKVNPLMMSDNASGFPHIDFGLRKTPTRLGDIEFYAIRGMLSESDFYDSDPDNDHTFISGLTSGFSPSLLPGLTMGFKWVLMTNWENLEKSWQLQLFGYDYTNTYFGGDVMDMKGSLTFNWVFPEVGFEWYFEYFREDYSPSIRFILLSPGHAAGWTMGGQKAFPLSDNRGIRVTFEWNELIESRDYEIDLGAGRIYYTHPLVPHGFTNLGQLLGAGIGGGSDAETLLIDYYDDWGKAGFMLQRIGWNKMYLYDGTEVLGDNLRLNVEMNLGLNGTLFLHDSLHLFGDMIFSNNLNYNYIENNDIINIYGSLGLEYRL